jgi:membrane protease YdiL (CAAX protease family)
MLGSATEENFPDSGAGRLSSAGVQEAMDSVQRARRALAVFFIVLLAVSIPLELDIVRNGLDMGRFLPLVFVPALASIVARLVMREGFRDISLRLDARSRRGMLHGVLYPIAVGIPAFTIAFALQIVEFAPPTLHPLGFVIPGNSAGTRFMAGMLIAVSVGILGMAPLAFGEEIGWRSYLLTRLIQARIRRPVLVCGLVWAFWHAPLVLSGQYNPSAYQKLSFLLFAVTMVSLGSLLARLRLETDSIWPPVVLHAAWNSIIVAFLGECTPDKTAAAIWVSEGGIFVSLWMLCVALVVHWAWRHEHQGDAP